MIQNLKDEAPSDDEATNTYQFVKSSALTHHHEMAKNDLPELPSNEQNLMMLGDIN